MRDPSPWDKLGHAGAILLSAFLLFAIQPLITKLLLPVFGGAPAVWNTALVFFQVMLLVGYAYAHWSVRQPWRRRVAVHALVLALPLTVLPPRLIAMTSEDVARRPVPYTLAALAVAVGLPFLALSTNSSLVQHAYARRPGGRRDPYWLYAASNAGSAAALLLYPLVLEPLTGLAWQLRAWTAGYALFALASLAILVTARGERRAGAAEGPGADAIGADPPGWPVKLGWVVRAGLATSLLLGTSMQITTDVAAIPLIWAATLLVYLLTFMLAFGSRRPPPRRLLVLATLTGLSLSMIVVVARWRDPLWILVGIGLLTLFFGAWLCHADLAARRPPASQLTAFYLWVTLGGALGGLVNSLLAPTVLDSVAEYPLTLAAVAWLAALGGPGADRVARKGPAVAAALVTLTMLLGARGPHPGDPLWLRQLLALSPLLAMVVASTAGLIWRRAWLPALALSLIAPYVMAGRHFAQPLTYQDRSFFGVLRILDTPPGQRVLLHGTTVHGSEWVRGPHQGKAGVYFHEGTVLGRLAGSLPNGGRMGIVGLGTGALAQQLRPGQHLTFYEIDPLVVEVARDRFGFLSRSRGQVELRVGDGRLALAEGRGVEPPYDLLLIDAFSSDAIPTHLLTREAFRIYLDRLEPEGVLAFHISNAFFDLEPVIAALAADAGLAGAWVASEPDAADMAEGAVPVWAVVLARDPLSVRAWAQGPGGRPLVATGLARAWTDDHVDLLSALRR